jgi:hypothetical protein
MPPRLDDVLSPELVLVDPGLRARARAAMAVPHWAPSSVEEPPPEPVVVEPEPQPQPQRRSRMGAPVGTLVATAVASLVVSAFSAGEQASGVVETDHGIVSATRASGLVQPGARSGRGVRVAPRVLTGAATKSDGIVPYVVPSSPATSSTSRSGRASAPSARTVTASPTARGGSRSVTTPAYDLELVRDGSVIYSTRFRSADVGLPRTWWRDGVTYTIQPEDRAYVWPIVQGRRRARPLVNGALALDTRLVALFVELSRSTTRP